ncbi:hypothetical protein R0135_10645 [Congregibacter variabilis]|uniref:TolB amino-terminal domain-containing protein n=1 Tax=Congregibacter variabilis TaxID=3081200 RepID=A0ABZ0HZD4_9GAMM|nr:hypothetical protein R0135_10645 [Congregibacter sp. IMCC43200]
MRLLAEIRRRKVLRTLALYILAAWGLMQVADVLLPGLGLPEESIRYLLFATIAGFPVALVFAWFFDITANGIQRTRALVGGEAAEPEPLRAADYGLLAALLLVLGLVLYGVIGGVVEIPLPQTTSIEQPERAEGPPMVGVLPFEHMGTGDDGEFFASGIHDDLLTRLAKIQSLRVISRTSVLQYAGTTKSIPQIGRELRADAVLEGGVRIAGSQIRINAQLIDARSDEHLWAETFDGELTASNIFEVQADIARAISRALQATLSEADSAELALIPTRNMAAYRAFHETMQWRDKVHLDNSNWERFVSGLEEAYELDPDFTRPMVEAVGALALRVYGGDADLLPRIEALIERIGNIAPNSADFYTAQSFYFYYVLRDFERADALIAEAQKKAPSDPRLLEIQAYIKRRQGDWEGYLNTAYRARALEPQNSKHHYMVVTRLMTLHRYADALEEVQARDFATAELNFLRAQLQLWQHQSLARYEQDLQKLIGSARGGSPEFYLFSLWEAQLAQRKFADAALLLEQMRSVPPDAPLPLEYLPNDLLAKIMHSLITDDGEALTRHLPRVQQLLGMPDSNPAHYPPAIRASEQALLALASGNKQFVIDRLGQAWNDPEMDRAEWLLERVYYCRMLSLAQALEQANACLRNALEEPSRALSYLEPFSPAYDAIRNTPAFQRLLGDLGEAGGIGPAGGAGRD